MKIKKIIALLLALSMLFMLSACKNDDDDGTCECGCNCQEMMDYYNQLIANGVINSNGNAQNNSQDNQQQSNQQQGNQQQSNQQQSNNQQQNNNSQLSSDPSQWSKSQIVEAYKSAAGRTHNSVTSHQVMTMASLSVPGISDTLVNFARGIMDNVLQNNSTDVKGITGGHQNLVASDVKAARAYKSGNYTVIEMIMNEQTDGANGNMYAGSVGHAISVVGPVDDVVKQFAGQGMTVELPDENVKLHYTNPRLKVLVNGNGYIMNGTWSYVCNVDLKNFTIKAMGFNVPVKEAGGVVNFVVTLNGGFKEA